MISFLSFLIYFFYANSFWLALKEAFAIRGCKTERFPLYVVLEPASPGDAPWLARLPCCKWHFALWSCFPRFRDCHFNGAILKINFIITPVSYQSDEPSVPVVLGFFPLEVYHFESVLSKYFPYARKKINGQIMITIIIIIIVNSRLIHLVKSTSSGRPFRYKTQTPKPRHRKPSPPARCFAFCSAHVPCVRLNKNNKIIIKKNPNRLENYNFCVM